MRNHLCLSMIIFCVLECEDNMMFVSHYDTYQRAVEDDAFERGWLPKWLPKTSYNISEKHDLDTSARAFSFTVRDKTWSLTNEQACIKITSARPPSLGKPAIPEKVEENRPVFECDDLFATEISRVFYAWN